MHLENVSAPYWLQKDIDSEVVYRCFTSYLIRKTVSALEPIFSVAISLCSKEQGRCKLDKRKDPPHETASSAQLHELITEISLL